MQQLDYLQESASQTAGPYVHIGLIPSQAGFDIFENNFTNQMTTVDTKGERITIEGHVIDGTGTPVRDVLLELWQANAAGKYNHPEDHQDKPVDPAFRGWGRAGSDFATGIWHFETIKPGPVVGRGGRMMAPHVSLWIVSRGINIGLQTRMYFGDETEANTNDPVLNLIEQKDRRDTLVAERQSRDGKTVYAFDIHLQGPSETVFFDV